MSTILGIVSGVALLFIAIFRQGGFEIFLSIPSIMITFGGTLAALFISFPLPRVFNVMGVLMQIFRRDIQPPSWVIALMVRLAMKARQRSLLSLEEDIRTSNNRFIRLGLEMVIDGHPAEFIRDVLETESDFVQVRHRGGEHIFRTGGKFAPAFGLIGTLIGLIAMLRSIGGIASAEKLGSGMAMALLTTFYGAMMANLFFMPVAEKLRSRTDDEMLRTRIIIEGVIMIQAGINPRIIERKLNSFLPPDLRAAHYQTILKGTRGIRTRR
ncbi:MAG: motility protein A [Nitrospinota bacterium]